MNWLHQARQGLTRRFRQWITHRHLPGLVRARWYNAAMAACTAAILIVVSVKANDMGSWWLTLTVLAACAHTANVVAWGIVHWHARSHGRAA